MSPQIASPPSTSARTRRRASAAFGVASLGLLVAGFVGTASPANAVGAPVGLGTATSYAILAGQSVTNTGPSVIAGDLGVSPGTSVTGFTGPPDGLVQGTIHTNDAAAIQAKKDLVTAYDDAAGRSATVLASPELGGLVLKSGAYTSPTLALTGTVTLDAGGDPGAVFVFQAASTLITAPSSAVVLINGASPCNVFWQIGSSATLDTSTVFAGTIMAMASATLNNSASVDGRVLARDGSVTLDDNVITAPNCATTPATTGASAKPTHRASKGKKHHSSTGKHQTSTDTTPSTPVIPTGHPSTGAGAAHASGGSGSGGSTALFALAGLAGLAALIAALLASEPRAIRLRR